MKKRPVIGISITVLVLAVVIGIASLPDEVLIDSTSIENSKTLPEDTPIVPTLEESQDFIANSNAQKNLDDAKAEIDALKNEMVLANAARIGAEKARESASKTLREVREIIGFRRFY